MKIERALEHRDALVTSVRNAYSFHSHHGSTSDELHTTVRLILSKAPKSLPQWVREYVRGYEACLRDKLYRQVLVHGGWIGDRFYSTYGSRTDYYEHHGMTAKEWHDKATRRGHYWPSEPPKPFFVE